MFRCKDPVAQGNLWLPTEKLPRTAATSFYQRLDRALAASGFGDSVRALCEPYYEMDRSRGGRPGIYPEFYLKIAYSDGSGHP